MTVDIRLNEMIGSLADVAEIRTYYVVQYEYVGGNIDDPKVVWHDHHIYHQTAEQAHERLAHLIEEHAQLPNTFRTGRYRVIKRTITTIEEEA